MIKIYFNAAILFCFSFSFIQSSKNSNEVIRSLFKTQVNRVDSGVRRPVRFCQGFEDPTEIDCYMRSDIKPYVCTEPVSFNPCESLQRVETFHYDHIIHKCVKVNVPACEGQIIRVLTLLQCLIYCHNKDPFALGKSRSIVFKLNQPKPYVPHEKLENERKKIFQNHNQKKSIIKSSIDQGPMKTEVKEKSQPEVKSITDQVVKSDENPTPETVTVIEKTQTMINTENENVDEDIFSKTLNSDRDLADYLINGEPNLLKREVARLSTPTVIITIHNITTSQTVKTPITKDENSANEKNNELQDITKNSNNEETNESANPDIKNDVHKRENANEEIVNEKKSDSDEPSDVNEQKTDKTSQKKEVPKENKTFDKMINENKSTTMANEFNSTDDNDKSKDDGFYLWDE